MSAASITLGETTVRCLRCGLSHPAVIELDDGAAYGRVICPHRPPRARLSGNAELFFALRARSRCVGLPETRARPALISLLPITDHCNFRCPVCYAAAEPKSKPSYLPVAEIVHRARLARKSGARTISLTGGEPTLHPELRTIIQAVRALGPRVYLVTNGLRLGTEPSLAAALRRAGLTKVKLQLDSFNPATHERLRGNTFIREKIQAARNVVAAGLRLGTIAMMTKLNLPEIGRLIEFGLSLAPALNTIVFQAAAPTGRFELGRDQLVDKEEMLDQLLACGALPDASLEDAWPLPHVEPWSMQVHPDCGVNILVAIKGGRARLAREFIDLEMLHQRLHALGARTTWSARNLAPLRAILSSTRPGQRAAVLRCLTGFLFGSRHCGMVVIGVGAFCCSGFLDEQRLAGCATAELTARGSVSPCAWYSQTST
jgi:organic radical activating enzyme